MPLIGLTNVAKKQIDNQQQTQSQQTSNVIVNPNPNRVGSGTALVNPNPSPAEVAMRSQTKSELAQEANEHGDALTNFAIGGLGELSNQNAQVSDTLSNLSGVQPKPYESFTPVNQSQQAGMVAVGVGEAAAVVVAAPIFGVSALSVVGGEAVNIAIDTGFKLYQGQPVTPQGIAESAAVGGAFALGGGVLFKGIGLAGSVGGKIAGSIPAQSVLGKAAVVGARTGINTGLGAGIGYVTGGPEGAVQGAAMGAMFSLGGEAVGAIGNTRFGQVFSQKTGLSRLGQADKSFMENVQGSKFLELQGVREYAETDISSSFNGGKANKVTNLSRISEPSLKEVTFYGDEAKFYKQYNAENLQNPSLDMFGKSTETIITTKETTGLKVSEVKFNQDVFSVRKAEPVISAVKGEDFAYKDVRMVQLPENRIGLEKMSVQTGKGKIQTTDEFSFSKADKNVVFLEKTVGESNVFMDSVVQKSSSRDFTDVILKGKIDSNKLPEFKESYNALSSKASSNGKGMKPLEGSVGSMAPAEKTFYDAAKFEAAQNKAHKISRGDYAKWTEISSPMKQGSNEFFRQDFSKTNQATIQQSTESLKPTSKSNEITLPKPIIKAQPFTTTKNPLIVANPFTRTKRQTIEETTYLSIPKDNLPHPTQPSFINNDSAIISSRSSSTSGQSSNINNSPNIISQIEKPFSEQNNNFSLDYKQDRIQTPLFTPQQKSLNRPVAANIFNGFPKIRQNYTSGSKNNSGGGYGFFNGGGNLFFSVKRKYPIAEAKDFWG